jgi:hypothetical protein
MKGKGSGEEELAARKLKILRWCSAWRLPAEEVAAIAWPLSGGRRNGPGLSWAEWPDGSWAGCDRTTSGMGSSLGST